MGSGVREGWRVTAGRRRGTKRRATAIALALGLITGPGAHESEAAARRVAKAPPRQPAPPRAGPGSRDYAYGKVRVSGSSVAPGSFVLYEPYEPVHGSERALPLVVYFHGAQIEDQRTLVDHQLRHIARKGFIVLYAEEGTAAVALYDDAARVAINAGLAMLGLPGHSRFNGHVGFVGFSIGGVVALRLAATPREPPAIPRPEVVVLHDPAGEDFAGSTGLTLKGTALAGLDPGTKLLILQAEESKASSNSDAQLAWSNSPLHRSGRNWLRIPTDRHGRPPMISDHGGSTGGGPTLGGAKAPIDAIDWWGYRRPTDGALAAVLGTPPKRYNPFCNQAGSTCDPVRRMGAWSDGRAVRLIANAADLNQR